MLEIKAAYDMLILQSIFPSLSLTFVNTADVMLTPLDTVRFMVVRVKLTTLCCAAQIGIKQNLFLPPQMTHTYTHTHTGQLV